MQYVEFINIPSVNNGALQANPVEIWGGTVLKIIVGNTLDTSEVSIYYSIGGAPDVLIDIIGLNTPQQEGTSNIEYYYNVPSIWDLTNLVFTVRVSNTISGDVLDPSAYDATYPITVHPESYPKDLGPFPFVDIPRNIDGSSDLSNDDVLYLTPEKFITNSKNTTPAGVAYETKRMALPVGYNNTRSAWYFNWMTLSKNDAMVNKFVRHYPELAIPSNVPYIPVIDDVLLLMREDYTDYPKCSHYVFYNIADALDINRRLHMPVSGNVNKVASRFDQKFAIQTITALTFGYVYSGTAFNFSDTNSFHILTWVSGIDIQGRSEYITYKIQNNAGGTNSLAGDGIYFSIDGVNQEIHIQIVNTSTYDLTFDISDLFAEEPLRYHSIGMAFNNGDVLIFIDGRKVYRDLCTIDLPDISDGYTMLQLQGSHVAIDELIVSGGPLVDAEYADIYTRSRVRIHNNYMLSYQLEKYIQSRVEFFAEGIHEVEYHQFSVTKKENDIHHLPFDIDNRSFMSISQRASSSPVSGELAGTWNLLIDLGNPNAVTTPVDYLSFDLTLDPLINSSTNITGSISGIMLGTDCVVSVTEKGGDLFHITMDATLPESPIAGSGNALTIQFENILEIADGSHNVVMSNVIAKDVAGIPLLINIDNSILAVNFELIVGTVYIDEAGSAYTDENNDLYIGE